MGDIADDTSILTRVGIYSHVLYEAEGATPEVTEAAPATIGEGITCKVTGFRTIQACPNFSR